MSIPHEQLLGPGGQAREALRASWGHWADEFCDTLLAKLRAVHVEDMVEGWGAYFVSYGKNPVEDGRLLNVRWKQDAGFSVYRGETLLDCWSHMLHEMKLIEETKKRDLLSSQQSGGAGRACGEQDRGRSAGSDGQDRAGA